MTCLTVIEGEVVSASEMGIVPLLQVVLRTASGTHRALAESKGFRFSRALFSLLPLLGVQSWRHQRSRQVREEIEA